jgi:hypothetical protein
MPDAADTPACDTGDEKIVNASAAPAWGESQRRFLDAYRQGAVISPAARLARVHRATVYRWRQDPAFVAAMRVAAEAFFAEHRAKVIAAEQAREEWRRRREVERAGMRSENLARAREAKWRKGL